MAVLCSIVTDRDILQVDVISYMYVFAYFYIDTGADVVFFLNHKWNFHSRFSIYGHKNYIFALILREYFAVFLSILYTFFDLKKNILNYKNIFIFMIFHFTQKQHFARCEPKLEFLLYWVESHNDLFIKRKRARLTNALTKLKNNNINNNSLMSFNWQF